MGRPCPSRTNVQGSRGAGKAALANCRAYFLPPGAPRTPRGGRALVVPNAGRFAPGPLAEVAASTHTFSDLADFLPSSQARELVAAERVVRGEDLSHDARAHPAVVELPLRILGIEPAYRLATYRSDGVEVPEPLTPSPSGISRPDAGRRVEDEDLAEALLDLVRPWLEESRGRAEAAVVDGNALEAIGALGPHDIATAESDFSGALELMAWAAASGGVHGRRRGTAYGRFSAWWATAEMCDLPWPPEPAAFADEGSRLKWIVFERMDEEPSGWRLGLAACSEEDGWGCAIYARDSEEPD